MITYNNANSLIECFSIKELLKTIDVFYPNFYHWYINIAIPDIVTNTGKLIIAKDNGKIIGCALGKVSDTETKLRCVRVLPEYSNKGIGLHLIDKMLKQLNNAKPYCTVSEDLINIYIRAFINYYKFNLSEVKKNMYVKGKLEYIFN